MMMMMMMMKDPEGFGEKLEIKNVRSDI